MMTPVMMKNDLKAGQEHEGGGGVRVIQLSHLQLLKISGRLHKRSLFFVLFIQKYDLRRRKGRKQPRKDDGVLEFNRMAAPLPHMNHEGWVGFVLVEATPAGPLSL